MCKANEEHTSYGPPLIDPNDKLAGYETAEAASDAFLEEIRSASTASNPALEELTSADRAAYLDYFDRYYGPAKALSAPERSRDGDSEVFSKPVDEEARRAAGVDRGRWSDVRIVVSELDNGRFLVTSAVICGRQLYDPGALADHPAAKVEVRP